jgi:hypothetical protein
MKKTFIPVVLLASLTGACGGFSENPDEPAVLATVEGEITNPNGQEPPQNLRVALIWSGRQFNVAHELEVVPEFPARFSLQIDQLPPEGAMAGSEVLERIPPGMRAAFGTVVGYVDRNQNARLDMVETGAESYIDELVATNTELSILYIEATDAALAEFEQSHGMRPPRGFNFLHSGGDGLTFSPLTENYELVLTPSPMLDALMCRDTSDPVSGGTSGTIVPREGRPEVYPSATDSNLSCHGSFYVINSCETRYLGPCLGTHTDCQSEKWDRPEPVPVDWPCQSP